MAASFLPLFGPLPPSADFVQADSKSAMGLRADADTAMTIDDTTTIQLTTLQVKVFLRGAQMADPEMTSALQMFRRAANISRGSRTPWCSTARLDAEPGPAANRIVGLPAIWQVLGGQKTRACWGDEPAYRADVPERHGEPAGERGVRLHWQARGTAISARSRWCSAMSYFTAAQTPNRFAGVAAGPHHPVPGRRFAAPFVHASRRHSGVVVALGGAPVELVVATDVSLNFLQVTTDPMFVFRVYEKIVLRIKEPDAIVALDRHTARRPRPRLPNASQDASPGDACPLGSSSSAAAWPA